jgi:hypothetical protein
MPGPHYDDLMQDHMTALGRVAAIWADLEFTIVEMIWELANVEREIGACITGQFIGPGPRIRALVSLIKIRGANPQLIAEFNKAAKCLDRVVSKRNRSVHDPWQVQPNGEIVRLQITADRSLNFAFETETETDLNRLYDDIRGVNQTFERLRIKTLNELPSWPKTQFEQSPGIRKPRVNPATD